MFADVDLALGKRLQKKKGTSRLHLLQVHMELLNAQLCSRYYSGWFRKLAQPFEFALNSLAFSFANLGARTINVHNSLLQRV